YFLICIVYLVFYGDHIRGRYQNAGYHRLFIRSHSSLSEPSIQFSFVPPKLPVELEQHSHLLIEYVSSMCMAFNVHKL
ncbi:unnamed protein product, partial [Rotaria socialis]